MIRTLILAATALVAIGGAASAATIVNGSFEQPNLGTGSGSYQYGYQGLVAPGWSFANGSGIAYAQSAWGFQAAPDGTQVAFLQNDGVASQTIADLVAGRSYTVSFQLAHRPNYGVNPIVVTFDGATIFSSTPTNDAWTGVQTLAFTATGTSGVLSFAGTNNNGDNDTGIDNVSIADVAGAVPEPATWAMMLVGFGMVGLGARRRRSTLVVA